MKSDDFEWDDAKAASNRRHHKITFEQAREVFADPFIIEWINEGQDEHEQRFSALGMVENRLLFVAYTMRGTQSGSFPPGGRKPLSGGDIMKKMKHDWTEADALTEAEIHAAALADPDAQPLTPERLAKMRRVPRTKSLRRALGLSQEEFATRYHIPVSTLRDWEQGRFEPDAAARAYLTVIAREPEIVRRALERIQTF
jgi:putative transcriptional regulator